MVMPLTLAVHLALRAIGVLPPARWRARHVTAAWILTLLTGGCASSYDPKPNLEPFETIGIVLPSETGESLEAGDVIQLYNLTVGEDRLKNSAKGAGAGAAVGSAAGIGAGAMLGCTAGGPLAPFCWGLLLATGAVVGGGTGAIAGATVDTQEQVEVAPVHQYEMNMVLPALQRGYLTGSELEERVLRLVRQRNPAISFMPAVSDGNRYRLVGKEQLEEPYTDVNLVLSDLRVQFSGKAENDPRVALSVHTQWALKRYDSATNQNSNWDVLAGDYQSKKRHLSEWLADDASLLMSAVDRGLDESLIRAFSSLGPEIEEEKRARLSDDDTF